MAWLLLAALLFHFHNKWPDLALHSLFLDVRTTCKQSRCSCLRVSDAKASVALAVLYRRSDATSKRCLMGLGRPAQSSGQNIPTETRWSDLQSCIHTRDAQASSQRRAMTVHNPAGAIAIQ